MPGMKKKMKGGMGANAVAVVAPPADNAAPIDISTKTEAELEEMANEMGRNLYNDWKTVVRPTEFELVRSMFDSEGNVNMEAVPEELQQNFNSATLFNDLYKWTMSPVILYLGKKHKLCQVTFGLDLRDKVLIKNLHTSLQGDKGLINAISDALKKLAIREFSKGVFATVLSGPARDKIFNFQDVPEVGLAEDPTVTKDAHIDLICGKDTPNKLANTVKEFSATPPTPEEIAAENPEEVIVRFYFDETKNDKYGNKGVFIIEATGPWHRVTWLETSMMQCVYEACLKYELAHPEAGDAVKTYDQWLNEALERCAKSIAFTYLVQNRTPQTDPGKGGPSSALFTDRRTGGLVFLLLQNLMFGDVFLFGPPGKADILPNSHIAKVSSNSGGKPLVGFKYNGQEIKLMAQKCLGTAACDAWVILTKLNLPCHLPIGTNAHELRMVASILYSQLDLNTKNLPLSQIIVDYLYYLLVWKKTGGLAPALPDTVGSIAFMKAAEFVTFGPAVKTDTLPDPTLLQLIGLPRQDSGTLTDFLKVLAEFGFKGLAMASEIDSAKTLFEAADRKYFCYGAGGFFGDSEGVWNSSTRKSKLSMAVKPTRVICTPLVPSGNLATLTALPYIEVISDDTIRGYPIKTGDAVKITDEMVALPDIIGSGRLTEEQIAKISIDRNLPTETLNKIINFVLKRKGMVELRSTNTGKLTRYNDAPVNISTIFDIITGTGTPIPEEGSPALAGGRRRRHRTQKKRRTNRKKTAKRGKSRKH